MRSTLSHPEASRLSFDLVTTLVSEGPEQHISPDNFPGLVQVLDDFLSTAGIAVESKQRPGRRREAPAALPKFVHLFDVIPKTQISSSSPQLERGKKASDLFVILKKWLSTTDMPNMTHEQGD